MNMIAKVSPPTAKLQRLRVKFADRPLWQRAAIVGTPARPACRGRHLLDQRSLPRRCSARPHGDGRGTPRARDQPVGRLCRPVRSEPERRGAPARLRRRSSASTSPTARSSSKGQLLFTIDPRPFAAALAEARAGVASARRATVACADRTSAAPRRLLEADAVSQSDVDRLTRAGPGRAGRAGRGAGAGPVARARRRVHPGPRADQRPHFRPPDRCRQPRQGGGAATEARLLTTINALDPIYFTFDVSGSAVPEGRARARETGAAPSRRAEIRLQDEADYRWRGRLDFTDNGIEPRIRARSAPRAVVANPDQFLTPGMFGNMRLPTAARRRRCSSPTPRSAPTRRARSCWSSARTAPSPPSRSRPARWSAACASSAPGLTTRRPRRRPGRRSSRCPAPR